MADNQPTILVKKSDGTFVRVPLTDLKKKPVVAPPIVEPHKTVEAPKPVTPTPKPAVFKSLLEDTDLPLSNTGAKTSVTRDSEVDEIIKKLSFTILPSFAGRLRNVVQLRLKDIRGLNETKDVALRSIKDGGLGLTESQADELEKKCVEEMNLLPQKFVEPMVPANTTPFNSFVHEEPHQINLSTHPVSPEFKMSSALKPKPIVRDVIAKPVEMGPIEEIKFFRLIDWRRMANNPVEAANRLKQKFINLREESILLFIEASLAWRESPLYQDYLEKIDAAFNKHVHVEAVTSDKEKITLEEIKALINMEKELGL